MPPASFGAFQVPTSFQLEAALAALQDELTSWQERQRDARAYQLPGGRVMTEKVVSMRNMDAQAEGKHLDTKKLKLQHFEVRLLCNEMQSS